MLDDVDALAAALRTAPPSSFVGHTYRVVPDEFRASPLSGIGSVIVGGRYNARCTFEAYYTSDCRETALREVRAYDADGSELPRSPDLLFSVACELHHLLDLTPTSAAFWEKQLEMPYDELHEQLVGPYLEFAGRGFEAPTQILGRAAFTSRRFSALAVPSAAHDRHVNYVIFTARLFAGERIAVHDPSGRWRAELNGPPD